MAVQSAVRRLLCASSDHAKGVAEAPHQNERPIHWVSSEAEELIAKAYNRHIALADKSKAFPPALMVKDLEAIGEPFHYEPRCFSDKFALNTMRCLRVFTHAFFREKYNHHAVVLETVAAVPGIVAGMFRHLRSLRNMQRDHGWINPLLEEAENERMHLLIWMEVTKPTLLERTLVMGVQGFYVMFYGSLYMVRPSLAHRLVGYLEEEAHLAYTDYLRAVDEGKIANGPAPGIAKSYYRMPADATLRDVILHVRADEAMHRDMNHMFGDMYRAKKSDDFPHFLGGGDDLREQAERSRD